MRLPVQGEESRREIAPAHKKTSNGNHAGIAHDLASNASGAEASTIVIIERRALNRECLARCLNAASEQNVVSFSTVEEWLETRDTVSASVILLGISGEPREAKARHQLALLMQSTTPPPVVVLSDVEDPAQIIDMLNAGARGYIPTSLPLDVAIESMRLVRAGGIFAPVTSLIAARRSRDDSRSTRSSGNGMFTARQAAVVEALRRGKANKIIAYELNMSESTVKVHVRNIMKKLRAKNRTEVAFMTSDLLKVERM